MPLRSLHEIEFDVLAFIERFISVALNGGIVNEDVAVPFRVDDEAIAFAVIEPFYFTLFFFCHG
jgi:hypothetical protein